MIKEFTSEQEAREERNKALADTDWIAIKYIESGQSVPTEWSEYRQALRDITSQDNFPSLVFWPIKPWV